jgi:hypothetical protein
MYAEDNIASLTRTWAEAVLRNVASMRRLRERADLQIRQAEYGEDWSPTAEDIAVTFREHWAAEHTLVWSAAQHHTWAIRLASELVGDHRRARIANSVDATNNRLLKDLRTALEHLDDANVEEYWAPREEKALHGDLFVGVLTHPCVNGAGEAGYEDRYLGPRSPRHRVPPRVSCGGGLGRGL